MRWDAEIESIRRSKGAIVVIYTVTFSPTLDYVVSVDHFRTGIINRTTSEHAYPGGKGVNVSIALKNFGFENTALGFTAGFTGAEIKRLLHGIGVQNNFIDVEQGMSRINMKIVSDTETAINGQGPQITKEDMGTLFARLRCLVDGDYLVLAGHIPDILPSSMYEQVLEFLNGRNLNVVVDAEKELLTGTLKYHPWLIKPNRDELGDIFGVKIEDRKSALPYARKLQEMGARNVLVSMGGDGAVLLSEDGTVYSSDALKGDVVSTVGAGDSMVAGFIAGYLHSDGDFETAFKQGMCAGAASSFSLVIPDARQVERMMRMSHFEIAISR
jgi:1-phosphofructokinase